MRFFEVGDWKNKERPNQNMVSVDESSAIVWTCKEGSRSSSRRDARKLEDRKGYNVLRSWLIEELIRSKMTRPRKKGI